MWRVCPPFFTVDDGDVTSPPHFVLEQIDDDTFSLAAPFSYCPDPPGERVEVNSTTLPATDLASIPWFASWFVSRHGRHTPAALLHDCLVHKARQDQDPQARARADEVFRDALDKLDVPPVRSRVMWAAVTLASRWNIPGLPRIGIALWLLAALTGTTAFVVGAVTGRWWLTLIAALSPLVGAVLWSRRQYVAGVVAGYALLVIALPTLVCVAGYGVYWLVEEAVRLGRMAPKRNCGEEIPGPTSFREVFNVPKQPIDPAPTGSAYRLASGRLEPTSLR
jgi:hypothetical protein